MRDRFMQVRRVVGIAGICLLGLQGWSCGSKENAESPPSAQKDSSTPAAPSAAADEAQMAARKPAPDFTLKDLDGMDVSLRDYRGKVVLVNFWATWCGPCRREIPDFVALQAELSKDLVILGVSLDKEGVRKVKPFAESMNINYPVLVDGQTAANRFGRIDSIPMTFFIDRQGRIAQAVRGMVSRAQVEQLANPLIAES